MARKQPMYGAESSLSSDVEDQATTFTHAWDGATSPAASEGAALLVDLNSLKDKVNSIIAALENYGILDT